MDKQLQEQVTKAALQATREALADDRLSESAKLLYLDVIARYAGSYGWMVSNKAWAADKLQELSVWGYIAFSEHNTRAVCVPAIDDALSGH